MSFPKDGAAELRSAGKSSMENVRGARPRAVAN